MRWSPAVLANGWPVRSAVFIGSTVLIVSPAAMVDLPQVANRLALALPGSLAPTATLLWLFFVVAADRPGRVAMVSVFSSLWTLAIIAGLAGLLVPFTLETSFALRFGLTLLIHMAASLLMAVAVWFSASGRSSFLAQCVMTLATLALAHRMQFGPAEPVWAFGAIPIWLAAVTPLLCLPLPAAAQDKTDGSEMEE